MSKTSIPRVRVMNWETGEEVDHQNKIQRIPGKGYRTGGRVALAHNFDPYRPGRFDPKVRNAPYGVSDGKGGLLPQRG